MADIDWSIDDGGFDANTQRELDAYLQGGETIGYGDDVGYSDTGEEVQDWQNVSTTGDTTSGNMFNTSDLTKLFEKSPVLSGLLKTLGAAGIGSLADKLMGVTGGPGGYKGGIPDLIASRQQYAVPMTGPAGTYNPSDSEIRDYITRPGMSDALVARGMNQFGISPDRIAGITGLPAATVNQRYQAALGPNMISRRPGSGGVTYFSPMQYSKAGAAPVTPPAETVTAPVEVAAAGGLMGYAGGGVTEMAIGGDTKKALEDAYAAQDYDTVNSLVAQNKITDADVRGTWGMDTSGLAGLGVNLYQPPAAVDASQLDYFGNAKNTQAADTQAVDLQNTPFISNNNALNVQDANPADKEIFDYFARNQNLVKNKDYDTIASDMYINRWTPEMAARATGANVADFTREYDKTYGAFDRATQENLVNQRYKKQLGLTDEQLGQRNFGADMSTRESRSTSKPFTMGYRDYQEEMASTGRRDAPAGTQFRTQAVFEPGAFDGRGVIKLYDTATGEHLTNVDMGNQVQAFELLDKFGVDPASYRKALGASFETAGVPEWQKDDYNYLMGYKPRDVAAATDAYLTKPLKNLTVGDLKPKYEKDDNNRQTADSKINVFYEIPMTKLLQSKGLSQNEASNLLGQLRPVAGLVNFAEISRSKDPVKAVIGTLNALQKKGVVNLDPNTGPLSRVGDIKRDAAGNKLGRLIPDSTPLRSLGFKGLASGGISSLFSSNLGGYSDGGRLLRGPGDGVSDSIPAMIGKRQPARLADGEFVVPARIVSELGNGSTEAGARKLYAMMDRIKKARSKAKNIAADTKSDKHLPA